MSKRIGDEIIGQKYGRLKILSFTGRDRHGLLVFCECECGNRVIKLATRLKCGNTNSCGCIRKEISVSGGPNLRHGSSRHYKVTPEYRAWMKMNERCNNPHCKNYPDYGARGIKVCERWKSFENFLSDMRLKPSPQHSLDRYPDVNGDYEPSNTRWATKLEQQWNRRSTIWIERDGVRKPLCAWAKELGFPPKTIHSRYKKGWPVEKLFMPAQSKYRHTSK